MDQSFGTWVKRRRKALDLAQQELAKQIGCSPSLIFKIESDERRPSRQVAELLAQHLEIPLDQRELFLKIARKEKITDTLGEIRPSNQFSVHSKNRIPNSIDSLVGREFELAEISRLLLDPNCHMLTLTGTGGIGKTRLALEAALQEQESFVYGGVFINLAPLNGRDQIVTAIADSLGIVLYNASDRSVQLIAHLHDKELLLVLDNFEHLLNMADCVSLPSVILTGAPSVKLLVTSREPLQLQAEWVFEVRGLPVPALNESEGLETSSAVRFFIQRAKQAHIDFELTAQDRSAVRHICQLVDGMPLAIELAAAWTRTLTCTEIAKEIQSNINFLATSARDVTERHRSIRATFEYSWKLLSGEEQHALKQFSIFKGGFTREAAEYVTGANLSVLSALVSKSLLNRTVPGRYDLHELVRQYSLEYLMKNEADYIRANDRHSEYYSLLLQQRGSIFKGADQPSAASELASEIANLRQAWKWAGERGQAHQISQAADTLFWLYEFRCDCREGVPLFGHVANRLDVGNASITATASSADETRIITQARVMAYQGFFCLRQGLHPQSKDLLERSRAMLRPLAAGGSFAARDALSNTLAFLGMLTVSLGDYSNGNRFLNDGLEIKRAINDGWGIAFCLRQLGVLGFYQGAYDEADRLLNEGLDISRALGNAWAIAYSLDFLSTAAYARGASAEAEKLLREGLILSQQVGDRFTTAYALNGLGLVKNACGEFTEARELLDEGITIWREIGDHASLAQSLNNLGDVLLEMKNFSEARSNFVEALSVAKKAGLIPIMLDSLLGEAILQVTAGEKEFAIQTLAHIINHPSSTRATKDRAEKLYVALLAEGLETARDSFREETFNSLVNDVLGKYASPTAVP